MSRLTDLWRRLRRRPDPEAASGASASAQVEPVAPNAAELPSAETNVPAASAHPPDGGLIGLVTTVLDRAGRSDWTWRNTAHATILLVVVGAVLVGAVVALGVAVAQAAAVGDGVGAVVALVTVMVGGYTAYRATS